MTIELLYFDGCPSWKRAWSDLGDVLAARGIDASIRLRPFASLHAEEREGFAGSPTIRVDGRDLEDYDGPGVVACRRYPGNGGRGWPSRGLLEERLRDASRQEPEGPAATSR